MIVAVGSRSRLFVCIVSFLLGSSLALAVEPVPDEAEVKRAIEKGTGRPLAHGISINVYAWDEGGMVAATTVSGKVIQELHALKRSAKGLSWLAQAELNLESSEEEPVTFDMTTPMPLSRSQSALAVQVWIDSPAGADSSGGVEWYRLYWPDAGTLRDIFEAPLAASAHYDMCLNDDESSTSEFKLLATVTNGLADISEKITTTTTPNKCDARGNKHRGKPQETRSTRRWSFNGVRYEVGYMEGVTATASSVLQEKGRAIDFYAPAKAIDGRLATAWAEGVAGPGIGEALTLTFPREQTPRELHILAACSDNERICKANHRIKQMTLSFPNGVTKTIDLADTCGVQSVPLADVGKVASAKLAIADVYKGAKYDDTCISEVSLSFR